jgi:hypothetical protein
MQLPSSRDQSCNSSCSCPTGPWTWSRMQCHLMSCSCAQVLDDCDMYELRISSRQQAIGEVSIVRLHCMYGKSVLEFVTRCTLDCLAWQQSKSGQYVATDQLVITICMTEIVLVCITSIHLFLFLTKRNRVILMYKQETPLVSQQHHSIIIITPVTPQKSDFTQLDSISCPLQPARINIHVYMYFNSHWAHLSMALLKTEPDHQTIN